jgi:hypothetical protein
MSVTGTKQERINTENSQKHKRSVSFMTQKFHYGVRMHRYWTQNYPVHVVQSHPFKITYLQ